MTSIRLNCYSLSLECPPKTHVLKAWSSVWCYWKVVDPLRGRVYRRHLAMGVYTEEGSWDPHLLLPLLHLGHR
jgi:hypothetical protein